MRVVSWTVVFGAVSALVYYSLKPFWGQLEWPHVDEQQARGTVIGEPDAGEAEGPTSSELQLADASCARDVTGSTRDDCPQPTP